MTYRDLLYKAQRLINHNEITLGEYDKMTKPLDEEVRKVGKWIIDDEEHGRIWHCHCSNCKKDPQDYIGGSENWWLVRLPDYCPNCGSKNER